VLLGCTGQPVGAQTTADIAGTWQGTLQAGGGQRIVVKISKVASAAKPGWKAVYYNFDSHAEGSGKLATSIKFEGQILQFTVGSIDASYTGKLSSNGTSIAGTWTQSRLSHPLNLQRANEDSAWAIPGADRDMPPDASPEFEVATIKPAPSDWDRYGHHFNGHQVSCDNETVNTMIRYAYEVSGRQIVGGPEWVSNDPGVSDPLGENYDLILASAICHMFSPEENRSLFRRIRQALGPKGKLVVQDFILEPDKTAPQFAALFSLNMLVGTRTGSSYSEPEYASWLRDAGFENVRRVRLPGPAGLMIATGA